jgi:hypothetical protein
MNEVLFLTIMSELEKRGVRVEEQVWRP